MKNLTHPYLCNICFLRVNEYGFPCQLVLEMVIAFLLEDKKFIFRDNHEDIYYKAPIAFLEGKGILVSTEIDKGFIQVLPNVSTCTFKSDQHKFCWCKKD